MEYHIHYPPNTPAEATQEASANVDNNNSEQIQQFVKGRNLLIVTYILLVVAFFFSLFYFVTIERSNNELPKRKWNEQEVDYTNSDFLIRSLLNSKKGKQFILEKLEELILSYENDSHLSNEDKKEKRKDENGDYKKHIRYEKKTDELKSEVKGKDLQIVNNVPNKDVLFPLYTNGKISNVPFLLEHLDGVTSFYNFVKAYDKQYETLEEKHERFTTFMHNYIKIKEHNNKKGVYFKKHINKFADMKFEELQSKFLTLKSRKPLNESNGNLKFLEESTSLLIEKYKNKRSHIYNLNIDDVNDKDAYESNTHYDWREFNVATDIKDQKNCGSCWAFSVVSAIEAQYAIRKKEHVILSEQQLVDCSKENNGCAGGFLDLAYEYVLNYGLCLEEDYPYVAKNSDSCSYNNCKKIYPIKETKPVSPNQLKEIIKYIGPISVGFRVEEDFFFYKEGIFDGECEGKYSNHAVLLIGYGVTKVHDEITNKSEDVYYYILKNFWGTSWGENGYARVITNEDGTYRKCLLGDGSEVALIE